jgi:hypothetical protein
MLGMPSKTKKLDVLRKLQEWFGGSIMIAERASPWKPQGQLTWAEAKIVDVIAPYLIVKKEQTEILLAMQQTKMPANAELKNEQAYWRLKILNKRGIDYAIENQKAG